MCYVQEKVYFPHCQSGKVKKNGIKKTGKQNFYCHDCKKQFQFEYVYQRADPRVKKKISSMSMRGSGIRDIANVLNISAVTIIFSLRLWFSSLKEPVDHFEHVIIDEFWSWVGKRKEGKRWVWYAYCADTRKVLAFQIGKRNDVTCKKLMKKLGHLDIGTFYTDDWKSYKKNIPWDKHVISKKKTQKIERQNLNFSTHIKRLCRRTICFSKKDDMHFGFIKAYVHLINKAK
ncbi:MAG: IS1 family transposase [Bacteroidota bacterium]